MIEYVEILIGGQVIQRIPSDFLADETVLRMLSCINL